MKACNDPNPDTSTDRPTHGRSGSLRCAKRPLSFFMPHRTVPWCQRKGNPTESALVNDMIKEAKKFKVRGEGAPSHAKRPLKQDEFRKTIDLFRAQPDFKHKRKCPMMAVWQCNLIERVDDVANFKVNDPRGHGDCDFALKTKVRWSKNIMEERQCLPQISLGAMDPVFCVILNLAIHLEECLSINPDAVHLFVEVTGENCIKNLIATCQNRLEAVVWKHPEFKALEQRMMKRVWELILTGSFLLIVPGAVELHLMRQKCKEGGSHKANEWSSVAST